MKHALLILLVAASISGCASLPGLTASKRVVCLDGKAYVMSKFAGLFTLLDELPDADKTCVNTPAPAK